MESTSSYSRCPLYSARVDLVTYHVLQIGDMLVRDRKIDPRTEALVTFTTCLDLEVHMLALGYWLENIPSKFFEAMILT